MNPAFTLRSQESGTDYHIFIASIPPTLSAATPATAVLFMDGDDQFSTAVAAHRDAVKTHQLPPLLLVGIGYGASYSKPANRRGRDYTPTHHPDESSSGGAESFTRFLIHTLWPELAQSFSLREDQRGIAGHSLGSLLAIDAFWREPAFFTHCLASAPSLWWDNRSILAAISRRHAANPELRGRLFLSVGENDSASMTGDLTLLEHQLTQKPFRSLEWTSRRYPRRNHFNVLSDAFRDGLTWLFASGRPSP